MKHQRLVGGEPKLGGELQSYPAQLLGFTRGGANPGDGSVGSQAINTGAGVTLVEPHSRTFLTLVEQTLLQARVSEITLFPISGHRGYGDDIGGLSAEPLQ